MHISHCTKETPSALCSQAAPLHTFVLSDYHQCGEMDEKAALRAARKARILGASGARLALVKSSSTAEDNVDAILEQSIASLEIENANDIARADMQAFRAGKESTVGNGVSSNGKVDSAVDVGRFGGDIQPPSQSRDRRAVASESIGTFPQNASSTTGTELQRSAHQDATPLPSRINSTSSIDASTLPPLDSTLPTAPVQASAIDQFKRSKDLAHWLQRRNRAATSLTIFVALIIVWFQFHCITFPFNVFDGDAAARSRDLVLEKISGRLEGAVEPLGPVVQARYQIDTNEPLCRVTEVVPLASVVLLLSRMIVYALFYPIMCAKFAREYSPAWLLPSLSASVQSQAESNTLTSYEDPIMAMVGKLSGLSPLLQRLQWWFNVVQPIAAFAWASVGDVFVGVLISALGYSALLHLS
jgi:hypothetical protein